MMNYPIKLLHIFNDEKFVDIAIQQFEQNKENKSFYVVLKEEHKPIVLTKSKNIIILETDNKNFLIENIKKIIKENKIDGLCLHALNKQKLYILDQIYQSKMNLVFIWFLFGFEMYQKWPLFAYKLYEPKTKKFIQSRRPFIKRILEKIFVNTYFFKFMISIPFERMGFPNNITEKLNGKFPRNFIKIIKKVDIVAPVIKNEMKFISQLNIKAKYAPFSYGYIEEMIKGIDVNAYASKDDILVGNSAAPTNNHLDIFIKLSKIDLKDRKVIVPLSYGGDAKYLQFILKKGKELLGDNFYPIVDFMPLESYTRLIQSCGFAIFNHIRQQAMGNVNFMAYIGAKIFINKKSPVFEYLKEHKLVVFQTDDINSDTINKKLTTDEQNINRKKIQILNGKKTVEKEIEILIDMIKKMKK